MNNYDCRAFTTRRMTPECDEPGSFDYTGAHWIPEDSDSIDSIIEEGGWMDWEANQEWCAEGRDEDCASDSYEPPDHTLETVQEDFFNKNQSDSNGIHRHSPGPSTSAFKDLGDDRCASDSESETEIEAGDITLPVDDSDTYNLDADAWLYDHDRDDPLHDSHSPSPNSDTDDEDTNFEQFTRDNPDENGVYYKLKVGTKDDPNRQHYQRYKECHLCYAEIGLGSGRKMVSFYEHLDSERCKREVQDQGRKSKEKKTTRLTDFFKPKGTNTQAETPLVTATTSCAQTSKSNRENRPIRPLPSSSTFKPPAATSASGPFLPPIDGSCPGVPLEFPADMSTHYPWQKHGLGHLSYRIDMARESEEDGRWLVQLRSKKCVKMPRIKGEPCVFCADLNDSEELQRLRERATDNNLAVSMNYQHMNYMQTASAHERKTDAAKLLRAKNVRLRGQVNRLTSRLDDFDQFMQKVAANDVQGLSRLIKVALKMKASPARLVDMLKRTIEGIYHVKSYEQRDYDIMKLCYGLGGPKLCTTVSTALNLPSLRTIQVRVRAPKIRCCLSFPTRKEIVWNLSEIHRAQAMFVDGQLPAEKRLYSLLSDEVSLDRRPRFCPVRNAVVGFAREDTQHLDLTVNDKNLNFLADEKLEGRLHDAEECTTFALAAYGRNNYNAIPFLLSGTRKTEKDLQQRKLFKVTIPCVEEFLRPYGILASIASDGDATRRRALHHELTAYQLSEDDPLYEYLGNLPLMNLACGKNQVTLDIDYKHKFKNLATLIRNPAGLLIMDGHLTASAIRRHLLDLPGMNETKLNSIFDPSDHQNVSKAVLLLSLISDAGEIAEEQGAAGDIALILLGKFLRFLTAPFTNVNYGLFEQLRDLSAAAHLLFCFYRRNRTSFCPGQLLYDIMTFIKNIEWNAARFKVHFPDGEFFVIQCGDDRLENLFGIWRLMSNAKNFDLLQLEQRAQTSAEINAIYARHPEWDKGSRRLKVGDRDAGVDHVNPKSWKGDVKIANVSLSTAWNQGRRLARQTLQSVGKPVDFDDELGDNIDLLRPFGDYVGVREDSEKDISESQAPKVEMHKENLDTGEHDDSDHLPTLEDVLPDDCNDANVNLDGVITKEQCWMELDGVSVHKASAVRYMFSSEEGLKATDRNSRVQGLRKIRTFTREPPKSFIINDSLLGGEVVTTGNAVASFISVDRKAILAIIRITSISVQGVAVMDVPRDSFALPSKNILLKGQVIKLVCETRDEKTSSARTWIWRGDFESLATPTANNTFTKSDHVQSAPTQRSSIIDIPAYLTQPIKPELVVSASSKRSDWSFKQVELKALIELLWEQVELQEKGFSPIAS